MWQEVSVQILFSVVRWARNTYAFPMLHFEDRVALLKYAWSEIFVLNASSCAFDIPLTDMAATKRKDYDNKQMREVFSKTEQYRRTVEALKELQPDTSEIACLKALTLFTKGKELWELQYTYPSTHLFIHSSLYPSIHPPIHLSAIYSSIQPPAIHPPIYSIPIQSSLYPSIQLKAS